MRDPAGMPHWPRALRAELAASYVGMSPSHFRQVVAPQVAPVQLSIGRVAWLKEDLDAWLDRLKAPVDGVRADGDAAPPEATNDRDPVANALAYFEASRRARRKDKAR